MSKGRTFENNGRRIREELIDPGRVNNVQGETAARHALQVSTPPPIPIRE